MVHLLLQFWLGQQSVPLRLKHFSSHCEPTRFRWPAQSEYGEFFQIWRSGILDPQEPGVHLPNNEALRAKKASFAYGRALANTCNNGTKFTVTVDGMMAIVPPLTEILSGRGCCEADFVEG